MGETIAQNRKARFDYTVIETMEAGIVLTGSEVKSLRGGRVSINEAYAGAMAGDLSTVYLYNVNIPPYDQASYLGHEPKRPRKLLLHKKQTEKILGAVQKKGMTLVPLTLYFNKRGLAKLELALVKGKDLYDKRQTMKDRDWSRDQARLRREGKDFL